MMESVLAKLAKLMGDKFTNLADLSRDTAFLSDELCAVNALLKKLEDDDEHELDPQVKDWSNQIRELVYDIEDCIDDFVHRVGSPDAKDGFLRNISHFVSTLRARLETAKQIKALKTRLQEINERRKRYKPGHCISLSSSVAVDPRLTALYKEAINLVGVDRPRDELIRRLTDEKEQPKVVAVIGPGGLGKTTLANEVYRRVKGRFACHAFFSVSQRPDMTRLLCGIRSELGQQEPSYTCEVKDLIDDIRKCLQHKRYLIVVDDLWDTVTWDIIRCAFPENNLRSRVIVTTRIENVAWACCTHHECFYRLKSLDDQDSRRLLFCRTFGSEHAGSSQINEVLDDILKKCGGLPLAIITIASILATQQTRKREDWENIRNSLVSEFGISPTPTLAGMRQVLNLSYRNLPHHLKTCLLYLGMYPEDQIIQKVDLVRQWTAEGLVSNSHRQCAEDVAKIYFDDLVNRSLIQPEEIDSKGEVLSCRVHDIMLGFIVSKCTEYNFVSVVYNLQGMTELSNRKFRRLSLNLNGTECSTISAVRAISSQPQVRSLALFGDTTIMSACAPLFMESKFVRVLVLDLQEFHSRHWHKKEGINLTGISHLPLLRYLKIQARQSRVVLPTQIRGLRYLETLETHCGFVGGIPSDIFHLPRLMHLIVASSNGFPQGISNAKFLRTLQYFDLAGNSLENIHGLGELMNLRVLTIRCFPPDIAVGRSLLDALSSSLGKLGSMNLRYLSAVRYPEICADPLSSLTPPPHHLETLDLLAWWFSRVPKWLSQLHNLCSLDLCVSEVMEEDVVILGSLPSLVHLQFKIQEVPQGKIVIHGGTGFFFSALQNFHFKCEQRLSLRLLKFETGAMPNLRRLEIETAAMLLQTDSFMPAGIEHLLNLKEICLSIVHGQGTESERIAAEDAVRNIVQAHPSSPTITVI